MRSGIVLLVVSTLFLIVLALPVVHAGDAVKVLNLEKLNTAADEEDPCPMPDGSSLLYVTKVKGNYKVHVSTKGPGSMVFGAGKPFKMLAAEKVSDDRSPFFYKDSCYFATNELRDEKFAKLKNFDLMKQIGFQAPLFVAGDVNTKGDEMYPWITPAGRELYFSRKTDDGWKLFMANGPVPGPIGKARDVGFPTGFHRATIGSTGLTMFLQGPLEGDRVGIFRSKRSKVGAEWSKPEAVTALNHAESTKGDMQPALSADGARLYFVSDRPGGKGGLDIWVVATTQLK